MVEDLASLRFVSEGRPVLFLGQPGCGKTQLAVAIATLAVESGYRGYFSTGADLVASLLAARQQGNFAVRLRTYTSRASLS